MQPPAKVAAWKPKRDLSKVQGEVMAPKVAAGLPLIEWLKTAALAITKIKPAGKDDEVHLRGELMVGGKMNFVTFHVHGAKTKAPFLGSVWASGAGPGIEVRPADNPKRDALLQLWKAKKNAASGAAASPAAVASAAGSASAAATAAGAATAASAASSSSSSSSSTSS